MKQKYVKPNIIIERFTLTQSIASGCQGVEGGSGAMGNGPLHWGPSTCTWNSGGIELFISNVSCVMGPEPGDNWSDDASIYCYNNPDGLIQIFSS